MAKLKWCQISEFGHFPMTARFKSFLHMMHIKSEVLKNGDSVSIITKKEKK